MSKWDSKWTFEEKVGLALIVVWVFGVLISLGIAVAIFVALIKFITTL